MWIGQSISKGALRCAGPAQMVECLPSVQEPLSSFSNPIETKGNATHLVLGRLRTKSYPWLHTEFEGRLGYLRSCLERKQGGQGGETNKCFILKTQRGFYC